MSDWYIARNGVKRGPVLERDLQELADRGDLLETDYVWKEGMADWQSASILKHINWIFVSPPPPPFQQTRVPVTSNPSSKALAAMACSIMGFFTLPILLHIVGMSLGYSARREIDASRGESSGRAYATTAIVLGWIALLGLGLIVLIALLILFLG